MTYKLILKQQAVADTTAGYLYYEGQQNGLGDRFLKVLRQQYSELVQNPQLYSYISADKEKTFRDVKLRHFPYIVMFDIVGADVIIYAVHNTYKKRPSIDLFE